MLRKKKKSFAEIANTVNRLEGLRLVNRHDTNFRRLILITINRKQDDEKLLWKQIEKSIVKREGSFFFTAIDILQQKFEKQPTQKFMSELLESCQTLQ